MVKVYRRIIDSCRNGEISVSDIVKGKCITP